MATAQKLNKKRSASGEIPQAKRAKNISADLASLRHARNKEKRLFEAQLSGILQLHQKIVGAVEPFGEYRRVFLQKFFAKKKRAISKRGRALTTTEKRVLRQKLVERVSKPGHVVADGLSTAATLFNELYSYMGMAEKDDVWQWSPPTVGDDRFNPSWFRRHALTFREQMRGPTKSRSLSVPGYDSDNLYNGEPIYLLMDARHTRETAVDTGRNLNVIDKHWIRWGLPENGAKVCQEGRFVLVWQKIRTFNPVMHVLRGIFVIHKRTRNSLHLVDVRKWMRFGPLRDPFGDEQ